MRSFSWPHISAWRLQQQSLETRAAPDSMLAVAARLGGLHAQVMSSAELTLAARVSGVRDVDVQHALWRDRSLIKTWANRGTLHLIPAAYYPVLFAVLGTLRHFRKPSWYKYFKISAAELDALMEAVRVVLTDAGTTREALADAVAAHTGIPALREMLLSGWGALLKPSSFQGDLAFGESSGRNVTFVKPSAWLAASDPVDPHSAISAVLRQFLSAYGPATIDEFARWIGLEPRDARAAFKALGPDVSEVDVEGWKAWALTESLDSLAASQPSDAVRLLPMFDVYTVAVARHAARWILPEALLPRVYRPQGWLSAVVLRGGRIVGTWDDSEKRGEITLTFDWFGTPDAHLRGAVAAEAAHLAAFWGKPVTPVLDK